MFTLTQNSFKELIMQMSFDEKIDHLTNLACLKLLGQSNMKVTGLAGFFYSSFINQVFVIIYCLFIKIGIHSLIAFFSGNYSGKELEHISTAILEKCKHTRLFLNCQVTKVSCQKSNSALNELVYRINNRNFSKNYDYVIIAFPLTKVIKPDFLN
jgi:hypothetical protein